MEIKLHEPSGRESVLTEAHALKELVLQPSAAYWQSGSGDLGLHCVGAINAILILVYCKEAHGFLVQLYRQRAADDVWVASNPNGSKSCHVVYVGGNPMSVPENAVISPQDTWEAVQCFFETGGPWAGVPWKSYWDIEFPIIE